MITKPFQLLLAQGTMAPLDHATTVTASGLSAVVGMRYLADVLSIPFTTMLKLGRKNLLITIGLI